MKLTRYLIYIFLVLLFLNSCITNNSIPTLLSFNYDEKTNTTKYREYPLGALDIPGKWYNTRYSKISGQYFFKNQDSVSLAIAFNPANKYEFYKSNLSENELLKEYYEWDSKYLKELVNGERSIIKFDTVSKFIEYRIYNDIKVNSYLLIAIKRGILINFSINTKKWNEREKINFLDTLYKNCK